MGEIKTMHATVCDIKLEKTHGLIVLLLAIFGGGWSSIAAGFLSKNESDKKPAIIVGLCQWFSSFLIVGYIWAIMTGFKIYKNSQ